MSQLVVQLLVEKQHSRRVRRVRRLPTAIACQTSAPAFPPLFHHRHRATSPSGFIRTAAR